MMMPCREMKNHLWAIERPGMVESFARACHATERRGRGLARAGTNEPATWSQWDCQCWEAWPVAKPPKNRRSGVWHSLVRARRHERAWLQRTAYFPCSLSNLTAHGESEAVARAVHAWTDEPIREVFFYYSLINSFQSSNGIHGFLSDPLIMLLNSVQRCGTATPLYFHIIHMQYCSSIWIIM